MQITAGLETGKPLALDSHGNILKYDRTQWIKHIGQARYITSTQGAFFMLEQKTGLLYQWKNGNWLKKDASHEVDKIYAGSESTLVGVNSKLGKLYKWQNENWIEIQKGFEGDVNSAGINSNGDIWVATRGGHVFRFQELSGQWTFVLNVSHMTEPKKRKNHHYLKRKFSLNYKSYNCFTDFGPSSLRRRRGRDCSERRQQQQAVQIQRQQLLGRSGAADQVVLCLARRRHLLCRSRRTRAAVPQIRHNES